MKATSHKELFLIFAIVLFSLFTFKIPVARAAICGDMECDSGENRTSCPIDCGVCGDLECDVPFEDSNSCPLDCFSFCGDLICDPGEETTCPQECQVNGTPICGDDVCSPGEAGNCPLDCIGNPIFCIDDASCDDGDPCTTDSCDVQDGCVHDPSPDTDGDGLCDATDTDDDNDGVPDDQDKNPLDPKVCRDADGDTCDDCAVGVDGFGPAADFNPANDGLDTDGDGICNKGDPDDDNDGICDGPSAVASVCAKGPDNCSLIANPRQSDVDADGKGDVCDVKPVENVDGLCPCTTCLAKLVNVEIPGVPAFSSQVIKNSTCSTQRRWKNKGEYLSCVTSTSTFLNKYVKSENLEKILLDATFNRCGF